MVTAQNAVGTGEGRSEFSVGDVGTEVGVVAGWSFLVCSKCDSECSVVSMEVELRPTVLVGSSGRNVGTGVRRSTGWCLGVHTGVP